MIENIKEQIGNLTNEDELRELREFADARLQQVKEEKAFAKKEVLEAKYKDKYIVKYGSNWMTNSRICTKNENDITIAHILNISFQGRGFFRCHAKVIHIEYDSESSFVSHLTADGFNEVNIHCFEDAQYDLNENEIDKIITQNEANEIIADAKKLQKEIMKNWNL